ncbi:T9SS type A sorting domain-containing protein [Algoriphagus pacificus]|uniref:T9SS type A sorting domain-containing protein n=1 Tax=Algoriphagus pacificus TaxID=2811234 RepID=A0ABS3CE12_9BACT|nr:T9SS type A sorting domain-containing protein [Algoriphagus pacificus]MBN7815313.1 T9SS type A sorting domain-containing protein [Algoriphagus pacificus]
MVKKILSLLRFLVIWTFLVCFSHYVFSQEVDNKRCPQIYKRNNGNGQQVTVFASNISPASIYYLSALSKFSQGNFTFGWGESILFPPVVTKYWITTTAGDKYLDWAFGNNSTGSPFNPPGIPSGNEVQYTFYNNNLPTAGLITIEFSDPQDGLPLCTCTYALTSGTSTEVSIVNQDNLRVSSGSDGGLESKSLGTAVVNQVFERFTDGNIPLDYRKKENLQNFKKAKINGMQLSAFIPDEQVLGSDYKGYITSPSELLDITNAEEVISVDYLTQGNNLATFFATKTSNKVYEHSKYVCDRLKGAEILSIDSVQVGKFNLIRSLLKPESGLNEYAVSFSVGMNANSDEFHLQSAWLLEDYRTEESFYNFQFWSADGKLLQAMIENVLSQLTSFGRLNQTVSKTNPALFVSKTERDLSDPSKVHLSIWNRTLQNSAKIQLTSKINENTETTELKTLEVSLNPLGSTNLTLDVQDFAEVAIDLLDQGNKTDYLYQSDGIWAHYLPEGGQLIRYQVQNANNPEIKAGEYPIFRNVDFAASGSEYATVYKTIKGGAIPADLSNYSYLNFNASGVGKLTIRLVKASVQNFDAHYSYTFDLQQESKAYSIPLDHFSSKELKEKVNLNDLVILSFTGASQRDIEINLNNIRFSNEKELTLSENREIKVFPNPFQEQTNILFESQFGGQMELGIYQIDTGSLVESHIIETKAGQNQQQLEFGRGMKKGVYVIKISSNLEFLTSKLLLQ